MEEKINEKILRVVGMASIENEIPFGSDVEITIVGSLVKSELSDNHDNTFNKIFKVKVITAKVNEKKA